MIPTHNLILSLNDPTLDLANAGGKGANLGRLVRAGLPVPPGFVLTTAAYRRFVELYDLERRLAERLENLAGQPPEVWESASIEMRAWFAAAPLPEALITLIRQAYQAMGASPVAVRSSATTEDLPELSFAGQQETVLNVVSDEALLEAVLRCWSSLWTSRAMRYREHSSLPHTDLALAVVVQEMVHSQVSGVLFTANPLTGLRSETVIDAALGLGEALVSGQVEPDQYVVSWDAQGEPRLRSALPGSKAFALYSRPEGGLQPAAPQAGDRLALENDAVLALARLGRQAAVLFDTPQDIEWAWRDGRFYLLQSRSITTLYPLPEGMPAEPLQVLASLGAVQGMLEPFTPYGADCLSDLFSHARPLFGFKMVPGEGSVFTKAGERLFIIMTPLLRNPIGRKVVKNIFVFVEPSIVQAMNALWEDPRLQPGEHTLSPRAARGLFKALWSMPFRIAHNLLRPDAARKDAFAVVDKALQSAIEKAGHANTLASQLALMDEVFSATPKVMIYSLIPCFGPSIGMLMLLDRLSSGIPEAENLNLEVTRGLPHNVTTLMDLELWAAAQVISSDEPSRAVFSTQDGASLNQLYKRGELPAVGQGAVADFLKRYGARGIAEIDAGRPRWEDDPREVLTTLKQYLEIDPQRGPDIVFKANAVRGEAAARQLSALVGSHPGGWIKKHIVRFAAYRLRAMGGLRELPKFYAVRMMALFRRLILASSRKMAASGLLDTPEDVFFLRMAELHALAAQQQVDGSWPASAQPSGSTWRELVAARRERYQHELRRRQVPRMLLSDGRAYYEGLASSLSAEKGLTGSPVSPGVAVGTVRVVFDPHNAGLQPGEIMVCPGTDPAWTPLFLLAAGLVMEVGGLMTHGAVVAREYGIPAVVGVHQATQSLRTGQRVRLDGSSGQIILLEDSSDE